MKTWDQIISIDWGTSNFRATSQSFDDVEVQMNWASSCGIAKVYADFESSNETNQRAYFAQVLLEQLKEAGFDANNATIVISGMASSDIGFIPLPYANLPFSSTGSDLICQHIKELHNLDLYVISGVHGNDTVIRGEETQAIGLADHFADKGRGILILPGTHSKHLTFEEHQFVGLKTFMTGEIFHILTEVGILSRSVQYDDWNEAYRESFTEGLLLGQKLPLTEAIFQTRVRDLFNKSNGAYNYYFLSGILIGHELGSYGSTTEFICLAAPIATSHLYALALESICNVGQIRIVDPKELEQALFIGHKKILSHHGQ